MAGDFGSRLSDRIVFTERNQVLGRSLVAALLCLVAGCAPSRPFDQVDSRGHVPNARVRAEAEKIARAGPTKCVFEFFIDTPMQERYLAAHSGDAPSHLTVTLKSRKEVLAMLDAFRRSSRQLGQGDPIDHATEVRNWLHFYGSGMKLGSFYFHHSDLRRKWGIEVADAIEPIYRKATAPYMPKSGKR